MRYLVQGDGIIPESRSEEKTINRNEKKVLIDILKIYNISNICNRNDIKIIKEKIVQAIDKTKSEINKIEKRKEYKKNNYNYELNRGYFYRKLDQKLIPNEDLDYNELKNLRGKYWNKNEDVTLDTYNFIFKEKRNDTE